MKLKHTLTLICLMVSLSSIAQTWSNFNNFGVQVSSTGKVRFLPTSGSGNIPIALSDSLKSKAKDVDVVHKTGSISEDITGYKVFKGQVDINEDSAPTVGISLYSGVINANSATKLVSVNANDGSINIGTPTLAAKFKADNITANTTFQAPVKAAGSYILATNDYVDGVGAGKVSSVSSGNSNILVSCTSTSPVVTLASTITSNTSGNAATASVATNSTLWNNYANSFATATTSLSNTGFLIGMSNGSTTAQKFGQTAIRDFLGLGSNAYTSTSFLPISGGTLTGALAGTTITTTGSVTAPTFSGTLNGGMTVPDPVIGGTASFKFDPAFNSWRLTSTNSTPDNRNIYTDGYVRADNFTGNSVNVAGGILGKALAINSSNAPGFAAVVGGAIKATKIVADTLSTTGRVITSGTSLMTGLDINTGTSRRWFAGKNAVPESGSNSGSNFIISRFDDSGANIGITLGIERSSGDITIPGKIIASSVPTVGDNLTNKTYVDAANALKLNLSDILTATATLDFPSVAMNQNATLTVTVTGAAVGDIVTLGLPNSLLSTFTTWNGTFQAWVSATNTVSIRFQNSDPLAVHDLASASFKVKVFK